MEESERETGAKSQLSSEAKVAGSLSNVLFPKATTVEKRLRAEKAETGRNSRASSRASKHRSVEVCPLVLPTTYYSDWDRETLRCQILRERGFQCGGEERDTSRVKGKRNETLERGLFDYHQKDKRKRVRRRRVWVCLKAGENRWGVAKCWGESLSKGQTDWSTSSIQQRWHRKWGRGLSSWSCASFAYIIPPRKHSPAKKRECWQIFFLRKYVNDDACLSRATKWKQSLDAKLKSITSSVGDLTQASKFQKVKQFLQL